MEDSMHSPFENLTRCLQGWSVSSFVGSALALAACLMIGTASTLQAQQEAISCDTLILSDKRIMAVIIDSVSTETVWFRLCADTSNRPRMLPYGYIREIRRSNLSGEDGSIETAVAFLHTPSAKHRKSWIFSKAGRRDISLQTGTRILVTAVKQGRIIRYRGHFMELDSLHLVMRATRGEILYVDKFTITKMKIPRKGAGWMMGMGMLALFLAGVAAAFALTLLVIGFIFFSLSVYKDNDGGGGCLVSFLGLAAAIGLFIASQPHVLEGPFGGAWTVREALPNQEVPAQQEQRVPMP